MADLGAILKHCNHFCLTFNAVVNNMEDVNSDEPELPKKMNATSKTEKKHLTIKSFVISNRPIRRSDVDTLLLCELIALVSFILGVCILEASYCTSPPGTVGH